MVKTCLNSLKSIHLNSLKSIHLNSLKSISIIFRFEIVCDSMFYCMLCTHLHEFLYTREIDGVDGPGGRISDELFDIGPVDERKVNGTCDIGCG